MSCSKNDILTICCKECDVKNECKYRCRKKFRNLCSFYLRETEIKYSCIFKKKLNKMVDK